MTDKARQIDRSQWRREAEGVLLGTLVNYSEYADDAFGIIKPEQFEVFSPLANVLYQMRANGVDLDYLTVKAQCKNGTGAELDDCLQLYQTANPLVTQLTVRQWASEINKAQRRDKIEHDLFRCLDRLKAEPDLTSAERFISDTLLSANITTTNGGLRSMRDIAADHVGEFAERFANPVTTWGVPTGFKTLDRLLGGLENDSLYIVAARPSVGKTALALALANNIARMGDAVAFFSLEMSQKQLLTRLTCMRGGFNSYNVRAGKYSDRDWRTDELKHFWDEYDQAARLPIWVDDKGGLTTNEARARMATFAREHPCKAVFFDYINLAGNRGENRNIEVGSVVRGLKELAKEFHVPVVALCQLNRELEKRDSKNKEPQLSDLRDSGEIEQAAQVVMFLHRDDYNNRNNPEYQPDHKCKVIVAKNQAGAVGFTMLRFDEELTRFEDEK